MVSGTKRNLRDGFFRLTEGPFDSTSASFVDFVQDDLWLADRTLYLPRLANRPIAKLFTRPRGFGKTLLVDTLAEYLDVKNENRFDELFGRFAVERMTPEERVGAGEYFVLRLDYSSKGEEWKDAVLRAARSFALKYPRLELTIADNAAPYRVLNDITMAVRRDAQKRGRRRDDAKLAILIDEYDTPLTKNLGASEEHLVQESGAFSESLDEVKSFYMTLKSILSQNNFRVYITGVLSLKLSRFYPQDISMCVTYDTLCGLEEDEVREGLRLALLTRKFGDGAKTYRAALRLRAADDASESSLDDGNDDDQPVQGPADVSQLLVSKSAVDRHVNVMKDLYDGYQFPYDYRTRKVYNPTMVAAYLAALTKKGFVEESELRQAKIEVPETAAKFLVSRARGRDLMVQLAADVPGELPNVRDLDQLTPEQLLGGNTHCSETVMQMLFLELGAATFYLPDSGDREEVKLRRPNNDVRRAIVEELLHRASADQQSRLRGIMNKLMNDEDLSAEALLTSVREFVNAALNLEAIGTPVRNLDWEYGLDLEAEFHWRLMTVALMSAELAQVRNVRIEAKTKKATTGAIGYYDIILGRLALELKVVDEPVRKTQTAVKLAETLASKLNDAGVADVCGLPDDVLLNGHASYDRGLQSAHNQRRDYDAADLGVRHKFAVLQILPNRALAFAPSDAIVQNGDDLDEDVQVGTR